jgi:two-component sensor histidine kinase
VKDVLERIAQTITGTMTTPHQDIHIHVFGESLPLPSRAATALTLVVNELLQNALEHAFIGLPNGQIDISLGHSPEELIVIVRDNGSGMLAEAKKGLGLELAETLVTEDLHGRIQFRQPPTGGTEISLRIQRQIVEELDG